MTLIEKYRFLERTVVRQRDALESFLPPSAHRYQLAQSACTAGTQSNALVKAICMLLANELHFYEIATPEQIQNHLQRRAE